MLRLFRAGEGVHAAYLERRGRSEGRGGRLSLALSPFHRGMLSLERRVFESPRLKAVVVGSKMVADEVVRHYGVAPERVHHIPNGIDLERFTPGIRDGLREPTRRKLGVADDRPVLLFVGSGFRRKGLDKAIEALARLGGDAELWAIGHDRKPEQFAALADRVGLGRRLRLLGPQPDVLPYYAAADALVLASQYDPFPSALVEALACGLPVVTNSGCGGCEAVERLDPRLVCDADDIGELAGAIDRAFDLAEAPGTAPAACAIAEDYGMERMVERMVVLYAQVAAEVVE